MSNRTVLAFKYPLGVTTTVMRADFSIESHGEAYRDLTNAYAKDPSALGRELPNEVLDRLPKAIAEHPAAVVFIAWQGERPVGLATCFIGFSTFLAKPAINIHDLVVLSDLRGQGVGNLLLKAVEEYSKENDFARMTLEVFEQNPARRLYERFGFEPAGDFMAKYVGSSPWAE